MAIARSHKDVTPPALRHRPQAPSILAPSPLQSQNAKCHALSAGRRRNASPGRPEELRRVGEAARAQIAVSSDVMTPADAHDPLDSGMGGRKRECEISV